MMRVVIDEKNDRFIRNVLFTFVICVITIVAMVGAVSYRAWNELDDFSKSSIVQGNDAVYMTECLSNDNKIVPVKSMNNMLGTEFMTKVSQNTITLCLDARRRRSENEYNKSINYYSPESE